jgi:hypothetical protein
MAELHPVALSLAALLPSAPPGLEHPGSLHFCGPPPGLSDVDDVDVHRGSRRCPSYHPGDLLKKCVAETSAVTVPPEFDAASDCSTADTLCPSEAAQFLEHHVSEIQPILELPSIGSIGHGSGLCAPCGFVHHKGGCQAGTECRFCHLCPPGIIEHQRKMKRRAARASRYSQKLS